MKQEGGTMDTLHSTHLIDEAQEEPLMRPFELVAIACGVLTMIGTFAVSHVLLKGLLIGGSLLVVVGCLLYFCLVGAEERSIIAKHEKSARRRVGLIRGGHR
ncbi:MAG: hypothetical protein HOI95_06020 [Chromatiales bacterium]|jgi:hypothetical protein|nr:hypothetical protein [Chromatiales bacterium]